VSVELDRGPHRRPDPDGPWLEPPQGVSIPDAHELRVAREAVAERFARTPAYRADRLSEEFSADLWIKLEASSPIRSFKHRGALWSVESARRSGASGVVTASTGNHGQGVALAGRALGVPVTVFTPERVDPLKRRQMLELGATLEGVGETLTDAEHAAKARASATGALYIEDGEDAALLAGAASIGSEIAEQVPEVDTVVVPVGGGNLIAGVALGLADARRGRPVRVVGVQSTAASGVTASWMARDMLYRSCTTLAGGLATEHPGHLALSVIDRSVDLMVLVHEQDLWEGIGWAFDRTGLTLELAAAAPFAALRHFPADVVAGRTVLLATGACIDRCMLVSALSGSSLDTWLAGEAAAASETVA
jgi:threonine dehydratase